MILWNIGIVCFIIELHQFTSGTPYIPQKKKTWSLYHSRDRIVAASRPLQIYTESANPIGAILSCFFCLFVLFCFLFIRNIMFSLLISVKVIKMKAIFIYFFFTYYKNCECTVDLYWFFKSRTTNIFLYMKS